MKQIAMEVAEGTPRPSLPEDHDGKWGELNELICLAWAQDPSLRPPFSAITPKLREIYEKFVQNPPIPSN